jgi:hypothetical protein
VGKNIYTVLYVAVSLICVSISVYLSYYGYYSHLEQLTIPFAIVIGLLLFGADLLVRQHRIERKSLIIPLLFFVMVATFSAASNFNFLYTNFMAFDMAKRSVQSEFETFRNDLTNTRTRLASTDVYQNGSERINELKIELENLQEQINDPLRPGCGERCRSHVTEINSMLGGPPTELAVPSPEASSERTKRWFENYENVTTDYLSQRLQGSRYGEIADIVSSIDSLLAEYRDPEATLQQAIDTDLYRLATGQGLQIIDDLRSASLEIERQANAALQKSPPIEHEEIRSDLDKIGEIPVSVRDGFIDMPNPGVTIVSLLLGLFVDVAPIIFALVLFSPDNSMHGGPSKKQEKRRRRIAT